MEETIKKEILDRIKSLKGIKNIIKSNKDILPLIYAYLCLIEKDLNEEQYRVLQTQKLTILVKLKQYDEALKICEDSIFLDDITVLAQKIGILIEKDSLDEALQICNEEKYKDNKIIQNLRIKALMLKKEYKKAIDICSNDCFDDDIVIQTRKIALLMSLEKYDEALLACKNPKIKDNKVIISHKVTILIKLGLLDDALEICKYERYKEHKSIASQAITIYIQQGKYEKAKEICNNKEYKDNKIIQSQKITLLTLINKEDEALKICEREEFANYGPIQSQKISIYIKLGKYKQALEICNKIEFKDNEVIQLQKERIQLLLGKNTKDLENSKTTESIEQKNPLIDYLFTCIYNGTASLDLITNSDISDFEKLVLKSLYYEKNKLPGFSKTIKKNINKYEPKEVKILKEICTRLDRKNGYLDYLVYQEYLNCNLIDDNTNLSSITLESLYKDEILEIISYIYINPIPESMKLLSEINELKDKTIDDSGSVAKFIMFLRKCKSNNIIKSDLETIEQKQNRIKPSSN